MAIAVPPATDDLGLALREGRIALGGGDATRFPQPRMAELLGVSLRQYQRWERGVSQPRPRDVARIKATLAGTARESDVLDELAELRRRVNALSSELQALRAQLA